MESHMPNEKVILLLQRRFCRNTAPRFCRPLAQTNCRHVRSQVWKLTTRPREKTIPTRFFSSWSSRRKTHTISIWKRTTQKGPSLRLKASLRKSPSTQTCPSLISEPILREENIHE